MSTPVRELGNLALSIGTSNALERFFGELGPEIRINYKSFDGLWINIETLIRNIVDAYPSEALEALTINEVVECLLEELEAIQQLVVNEGNNKTSLVIYIDDVSERRWVFPNAEWRKPTTARQQRISTLNEISTRQAVAYLREKKMPLSIIRRRPFYDSLKVAILTHHPHNLLWSSSFSQLTLLESYTGTLKQKHQWNSKLKGIKEKDAIPFNALTLQVIGDKELFAGESRIIVKELKKLAEVANWTKVTTREKTVNDIRTKGSTVLKETYNKLMSRH